MMMTSGWSSSHKSTASLPFEACPTTSNPDESSKKVARLERSTSLSSAIMTLIVFSISVPHSYSQEEINETIISIAHYMYVNAHFFRTRYIVKDKNTLYIRILILVVPTRKIAF